MIRQQALQTLHRIAHHPALNLLAGLILLVTGLLEVLATTVEGLFDFPLGAHHGIVVFGFLQMIKALPDVMKGVKFVDDGELAIAPARAASPFEARTGGMA
ncbi:MAG: hypothetical protein WD875_00305 [Pirellulales bacterium]